MGKVIIVLALLFLTAQTASAFTLKLTWDDNSNDEDGFIIEHRFRNGAWKEFSRVGKDVTTTTVTIDELADKQSKKHCFRIVTFILPGRFALPSNISCNDLNQKGA